MELLAPKRSLTNRSDVIIHGYADVLSILNAYMFDGVDFVHMHGHTDTHSQVSRQLLSLRKERNTQNFKVDVSFTFCRVNCSERSMTKHIVYVHHSDDDTTLNCEFAVNSRYFCRLSRRQMLRIICFNAPIRSRCGSSCDLHNTCARSLAISYSCSSFAMVLY